MEQEATSTITCQTANVVEANLGAVSIRKTAKITANVDLEQPTMSVFLEQAFAQLRTLPIVSRSLPGHHEANDCACKSLGWDDQQEESSTTEQWELA